MHGDNRLPWLRNPQAELLHKHWYVLGTHKCLVFQAHAQLWKPGKDNDAHEHTLAHTCMGRRMHARAHTQSLKANQSTEDSWLRDTLIWLHKSLRIFAAISAQLSDAQCFDQVIPTTDDLEWEWCPWQKHDGHYPVCFQGRHIHATPLFQGSICKVHPLSEIGVRSKSTTPNCKAPSALHIVCLVFSFIHQEIIKTN